MNTFEQIKNSLDFVKAPPNDECLECSNPAVGEIEWWNYGDDWDFAASGFLCEKHLLEKYGEVDLCITRY